MNTTAQQQEPVARYFEQWQGQSIEEIDEERFNQTPEECRFKLYTSQPARKPLTDEQIMNIAPVKMTESMRALVRAIEKAHGIEPELPF